jgi:Ca2+-binding EF-hand superfamily protein
VSLISPTSKPSASDIIYLPSSYSQLEYITLRLVAAVEKSGKTIKQHFQKEDFEKSGGLAKDQFTQMLREKIGFWVTDSELEILYEIIDPEKTDYIQF